MKYIYVLLLSFFFVGCGEYSDDYLENESSLNNGGNGTKERPYVIGSGIFEINKDYDEIYFTFDVKDGNDDCSMLLYDVLANEGRYYLKSNETTFNTSSNQDDDYYLVTTMGNGSYILSNDSEKNSKFGLYSPCVKPLDDYELNVFKDEESFTIKTKYELFTFTLDRKKSIKLEYSGDAESYDSYFIAFFNSDFQRIYSSTDLEAGTYYLLLEGSDEYPPKVKFILE